MREYYIRREGDEDASGPYDLDQITSLFEAGKLDKEAYVYDIDQENWIRLEECEELMKELFPEKKKLTLRTKKPVEEEAEPAEEETLETEGTDPDAEPEEDEAPKSAFKLKRKTEEEEQKKAFTVTEMLAQAEGREGDDPRGKSPIEKRAQAAFVGLRFATLFTLGAAASMIFLEWDLVLTANFINMMKNPYLVFAAVDIVLSVFLILQVTDIFPLVRFRAAIGLGTITILFLASGDFELAAANAVLAISTYFSTATLSLPRAAIPCGITGTLALAAYVYLVILPQFA